MREDAILREVKPDIGFLPGQRSLTVSQFQIGIVMQDGEVVDIFSSRKRKLPWNLPWNGEVRTYVASTAPFTLTFWLMDPMDREEPGDSVVLGQPVLTSDDEAVTGRLALTMRVVRENVEHLLQLLRPGSGGVTRRDVSDAIKDELLDKVLALDIHQHTAEELRGNRELFRGIYESVNIELASTIRFYGLRLDNFTVSWGLTSEERERIRQRRHEEELEEIRRQQEIRQRRHEEELEEIRRRQEIEDLANRARGRERQDAERRHRVDKFPPEVRDPVPEPEPLIPTTVGPPTQPPTRTRVGPPPNTPPSLPEKYHAFFQPLVDTLREKYPWFTGATKGGSKNWKAFSATPSLSGSVSYRVVFDVSRQVMVNIYIERNEDTEWNKWLFDQLMERKDSIESKLGSLFWDRMEGDMACRIAVYRPGTIYEAEETLKEIREWAIEHLLAFDRVFGPELERLLKLGTRRRPVNRR